MEESTFQPTYNTESLSKDYASLHSDLTRMNTNMESVTSRSFLSRFFKRVLNVFLRGSSMGGDNYAALLLSRYRSGSTMKLVTVSSDGTEMASLDSSQEVLSMSAAGKYIAVLYSDSLVLYTPQLQEYARLDGTEYARSVIMREDGTAVLIGSSSAWLYIP